MRSFLTKGMLLGAVFALGGLVFIVARGGAEANPADPLPTGPQPEPITGIATWPEPGDETGPINPFAPPEPGNVAVEDLSPAEQDYVAANADVTGWAAIHAGFSSATQQAAADAQAQAAANALGLEGLGDTGVQQ